MPGYPPEGEAAATTARKEANYKRIKVLEAAQADDIIAVEALAKHRGNIEKLSIPQLKSIIISKTFNRLRLDFSFSEMAVATA